MSVGEGQWGKGMLRNWQRPGAGRGGGGQEGGGWEERWQCGGGDWEGGMGTGRWGGGHWVRGETGKGEREGATGRGRRSKEEGGISQMDMMECLGGHRL